MSQQKKICMVGFCYRKNESCGAFKSTYSDIYHTTVSVKIDKKLIKVRDEFQLLWDLHTEDEFQNVRISYLRGLSGLFW